VTLDLPKKAVPSGTAYGVQLVKELKSPEPGVVFQVESTIAQAST